MIVYAPRFCSSTHHNAQHLCKRYSRQPFSRALQSFGSQYFSHHLRWTEQDRLLYMDERLNPSVGFRSRSRGLQTAFSCRRDDADESPPMLPRLPYPIRRIRQFETKEKNFVQTERAEAIHEWRLDSRPDHVKKQSAAYISPETKHNKSGRRAID